MKKRGFLVLGILLVGSVLALSLSQNLTVNILPGAFEVFSPVQDAIHGERLVPINLTMSTEVFFFKYSDNGSGLKTLCRNCDEYGFSELKRKGFSDGFHELVIFGVFENGNVSEIRNFTVDSKTPKVIKTTPKVKLKTNPLRTSVTNGSDFSVRYTEENVEEILLRLNPVNSSVVTIVNITNQCNESGQNVICNFQVDLTAFDGQQVFYWINITDIANHTGSSRPTKVFVDTTDPVLTVNSPVNNSTYGRRVPFNLSVNEQVNTLEFIDNSDSNPHWEKICSHCDSYGSERLKTKSFKVGEHNLMIRAVDYAGNTDVEPVSFDVV
jgi:hypothetical protein